MPYQVYRVLNLTNNKVYIGITCKTYKARFRYHVKEMEAGSNFIFHHSLRKYGSENFEVSLLETCQTIDQLKEREKYWIGVFDSTNREKGYNMTLGGDGTFGRLHSEETKEVLSERKKLPVTLTNTLTKEVLVFPCAEDACEILELNRNTFSVRKFKANKKGIPFVVNEWEVTVPKREKQGTTKQSPYEVKRHQDKAQKASVIWRKEHPEESRKAMMAGRTKVAKAVDQLTLSGEYIQTFPSSGYAADAVLREGQKPTIVRTNIRNSCKGKTASANGYKWRWSTNTTTAFTAQVQPEHVVGD